MNTTITNIFLETSFAVSNLSYLLHAMTTNIDNYNFLLWVTAITFKDTQSILRLPIFCYGVSSSVSNLSYLRTNNENTASNIFDNEILLGVKSIIVMNTWNKYHGFKYFDNEFLLCVKYSYIGIRCKRNKLKHVMT